MRSILSTLACLLFLTAFSQYSNPYRIAHDGTNYFITNHGNGTVTKLDGSFNTSTVISGLGTPNDIFFGSVGTNAALIVIDSNKLKLYDPLTYGSLINVNISFATEAHDGILNPSNTNLFYIGDRAGNKIIKGSIGPAPFYPITFTTLATGIIKPAGMIFNDSNQLIVVSDTTDGNIYEVNVTSGAVSVKQTTTIDNLNDIAQDNEGNYYITNWGDDKLYRFDVGFGNQTALTTHNNPAGLFTNYTNDFLALACHGCGTLEFKNFHLFAPLADVSTCKTDSFVVDFSPTFNGIGTYYSNNNFIVELSDSNGSFNTPDTVGSVATAIVPSSIKCLLPAGDYASTGYKYRLLSTSPAHEGFGEKNLTINPTPNASFGADTIFGCVSDTLTLTTNHDANTAISFFPPIGLWYADSVTFKFLSDTAGDFQYWFQKLNTLTGCVEVKPFIISINSTLPLQGLDDTITMCKGDTTEIRHQNWPYEYVWNGSSDLDEVNSINPNFYGDSSVMLYVNFNDSGSNTCVGLDSVYIKVIEGRELFFPLQNPQFCLGQTINIDMSFDTTFSYSFHVEMPKISVTDFTAVYSADTVGTFNYHIKYTDKNNGCSRTFYNYGIIHDIVDTIGISYNSSTERIEANLFGDTGTIIWYVNSTVFATDQSSIDRYDISNGDSVKAVVHKNMYCFSNSNVIVWSTAGEIEAERDFTIYPNPSSSFITIDAHEPIHKVSMYSSTGQLTMESDGTHIDVSSLQPGLYVVRVKMASGIGSKMIVID